MNLIWFSEIKWLYLKTRKQQILSNFPSEFRILFIEPISKSITNNYCLKKQVPVVYTTIPQIRSTKNGFVSSILKLSIIRKIFSILSTIWVRILLKKYSFIPDIIIVSNVYWIDTIIYMKRIYKNIKIIYDCNDDPLSFPNTPAFKNKYFYKTIEFADKIVFPHESYEEIVPIYFKKKFEIIYNGVDYNLFQNSSKDNELMNGIKHPVIMYIGAISEWIDFELIKDISQSLKKASVVLIGPVSSGVSEYVKEISKIENIIILPPVPHEKIPSFLNYADVCIIPFIRNKLTKHVLPNKLFEYLAAGKNCVITEFNNYLFEYSEVVFISSNKDEFLDNINKVLENPLPSDNLQHFAKKFDWKLSSIKYRKLIYSMTKS